MLVLSLSTKWELHPFGRYGEARRTGRDPRAGQRYGMDSPGTWELLCATNRVIASGTGLERDQAQRCSPPHGSELGESRLERRGESISTSVFGTGSRSALIRGCLLANTHKLSTR